MSTIQCYPPCNLERNPLSFIFHPLPSTCCELFSFQKISKTNTCLLLQNYIRTFFFLLQKCLLIAGFFTCENSTNNTCYLYCKKIPPICSKNYKLLQHSEHYGICLQLKNIAFSWRIFFVKICFACGATRTERNPRNCFFACTEQSQKNFNAFFFLRPVGGFFVQKITGFHNGSPWLFFSKKLVFII